MLVRRQLRRGQGGGVLARRQLRRGQGGGCWLEGS